MKIYLGGLGWSSRTVKEATLSTEDNVGNVTIGTWIKIDYYIDDVIVDIYGYSQTAYKSLSWNCTQNPVNNVTFH